MVIMKLSITVTVYCMKIWWKTHKWIICYLSFDAVFLWSLKLWLSKDNSSLFAAASRSKPSSDREGGISGFLNSMVATSVAGPFFMIIRPPFSWPDVPSNRPICSLPYIVMLPKVNNNICPCFSEIKSVFKYEFWRFSFHAWLFGTFIRIIKRRKSLFLIRWLEVTLAFYRSSQKSASEQ